MLELSKYIKITPQVIKSPNLCNLLGDEDLVTIGNSVLDSYNRDLASRAPWAKRVEAAMDLAMQIQHTKSFPWKNCSNVAFPLVTIAALQFHARAYPAIITGRSVVQCRVVGADPDGSARARADRIGAHMSWQLLEQDESWEEEQDRALLNVPIVGCAFKKSYYNSSLSHNVSEVVLAKDFILDYWAKSVEDCRVKTHVIPVFRNDVYENCQRGIYTDVTETSWFRADAMPITNVNTQQSDNRAGLVIPQSNHNTPFTFLEQHCWLDLDDDGYEEPYIVTIESSTATVVRIVTRFNRIEDVEYNAKGAIVRITATEYFTKIPFIPSPDGGIMDIGFGTLLGPLNESVNTSINQLFDSATMSNTAGGFLGRGAKIRGGQYQFQPFGWNRVDSTGDDLRKNIFPLPVREPSNVMFQLLSLLIDYTNRISGSTDMLAGENPGQNTPAETARTMVQQGEKIYSAIFKRIWRSMKQEFKKLYILNAINLPASTSFGDGGEQIMREDYAGGTGGVCPVADPYITSESARFAQAQIIAERASLNPGYDQDVVEVNLLRALGVDQIKLMYPGQKAMPEPAPDIKLQVQQMKNDLAIQQLEVMKMNNIMTLQEQQRLNNAKIEDLMAKTFKAYQEGEGVQKQDQINEFIASTDRMRVENEHLTKQIQIMMDEVENDRTDARERAISRMAKSSGDKKSS